MFDLFRSRDKAVRYLLGALLGIVALSMVITLIPGFGSSTGSSADDDVIAEIGPEKLTARQVQNSMQAMVRDRQIPSELMQVYLPQQVDQMITERALAYQAHRMGFEVPDAELAANIRSILPRFFQNGALIDKRAYEQFLQQQGYTIPEFEENVRKQIIMTRLMNLSLEGIMVTPDEAKQEFERRNAKYKIAYVGFKAENLKSQVTITPAELQGYYESNKEGFREGEKRNVAVLVADQDKMAASIEVPETQVKQLYEQRKESFRTPERAKVRHILLMTQGKPADEVAKIKAKAEALRKQVTNANFGDLAQKNSEDPGSKDKGGDLGWVMRGQMVPPFEAASFTQKPGEIGPIVTTQYGFHIVQVEDRQPAHLQTFDEVKAQLAAELKKAQVTDRVQNAIEQARAALAKTPANIDGIAKQYNLEVVRGEKAAPGSPVGSLPPGGELDNAYASLKQGEVSPVFQISPTKLGVAEVTAIIPSSIPPFSQVEAKVRDNLSALRAQTLATERAAKAAERAKAGEDLQKIAKDLNGEYKAPAEFTSDGAVEGIGSAAPLQSLLSKKPGDVGGPFAVMGQNVVAKLVEKNGADMTAFEKERDQIVTQLKGKKSQERKDLFQDSILTQLIKEGKVKKHNETLKRMMAAYRS